MGVSGSRKSDFVSSSFACELASWKELSPRTESSGSACRAMVPDQGLMQNDDVQHGSRGQAMLVDHIESIVRSGQSHVILMGDSTVTVELAAAMFPSCTVDLSPAAFDSQPTIAVTSGQHGSAGGLFEVLTLWREPMYSESTGDAGL